MRKSLKLKVAKSKKQSKWDKFFDTFISLSVILGIVTGIIAAFYYTDNNFSILSNFVIFFVFVSLSVIFSYVICIAILSIIALTLDSAIPSMKKFFHDF